MAHTDDPEPCQALARLVLLPIDLSAHLPEAGIHDALDLNGHRAAARLVSEVMGTLPMTGVPLLNSDAERRTDVLRRVPGKHVLFAVGHRGKLADALGSLPPRGGGSRMRGWWV